MADDIVAELDARIHDAEQSTDYAIEWRRPLLVGFLQRTRDEIVALREERNKLTWEIIDHAPERDELVALRDTVERQKFVLSKGHAETRNEALEEAARVCDILAGRLSGVLPQGDAMMIRAYENAAAAIRALKDKRDD